MTTEFDSTGRCLVDLNELDGEVEMNMPPSEPQRLVDKLARYLVMVSRLLKRAPLSPIEDLNGKIELLVYGSLKPYLDGLLIRVCGLHKPGA
ncbi:hypothetical protein R6Q57_013409 [Mikania cordata]